MQFLVLGCGTIVQRRTFYRCSGYLVDNRILLDCGPGIWHALCKERICIPELNFILLSHFHVDHTSDLGAILLNRYLQKEKVQEALMLIGPVGLVNWFNRLKGLLSNWVDELEIQIREIGKTLRIQDYQIETGRTMHTENSTGYRITNQSGKVVFYSGDSGYHENLIQLAKGVNLAVLEASCMEESQMSGHLTPAQAGEIARQAGVKRLLLTHRYPEVTDSIALRETKKKFKGEILLAADGLKIIL